MTQTTSPTPRPEADLTNHDSALAALRWSVEMAHGRGAPRPARPSREQWESVPIDILRKYLDELIILREVENALDGLQQLGCFEVWLPEVEEMIGMSDGEWRHKDVWKHTRQVVRQAVPRLEVRWGALLHDIGKPRTRKIDENGRVTFHGHAELGARMFRRKVGRRLGFEGELKDRVHFLILHHLRPGQYEASWTDAAVRRFYKQMGDGLKDLLDLGRADITTKRPEKRRRGVRNISDLSKRISALQKSDAKVRPLPKGLGKAVIDHFGIAPSKQLGNLMADLEAAADAGEVPAHQPFEVYLEFLTANAKRFGLQEE